MLLWSETFLEKFWRFLETTQSDLSVQHHSLMCSHVTCLHRLQLRRLGGLWRMKAGRDERVGGEGWEG